MKQPPIETTQRVVDMSAGGEHHTPLGNWLAIRKNNERLRIGVSFLHLSCHGFAGSESSRYQQTVTSWALAIPRFLVRFVSGRPSRKVQILHDFSGIVKPGEMLLVLGRPGSGCSTMLKTLAGDTHGFHVEDTKSVNYQGLFRIVQETKALLLTSIRNHIPGYARQAQERMHLPC